MKKLKVYIREMDHKCGGCNCNSWTAYGFEPNEDIDEEGRTNGVCIFCFNQWLLEGFEEKGLVNVIKEETNGVPEAEG